MKRLLSYLFIALGLGLTFSFQSFSKADEIRDFQIEGMSIGDNLLDYFTKEQIKKKGIFYYPKSKRIGGVRINKNNYKLYESTQFTFYPTSYEITSVAGLIEFDNNIDKCLKKKIEIQNSLLEIFSSVIPKEKKIIHPYDKSGNSIIYKTAFNFKDGSSIQIECFDWAKGVYSQNSELRDTLSVSLNSIEYINFLSNEAY